MSEPIIFRSAVQVENDLARRVRQVRVERFGEHSVRELASRLEIPPQTWANFENGVIIPGELILAFLLLTDAEPMWLLRGEGPRFRSAPEAESFDSVGRN